MIAKKVSRADRRLARLVTFLESKLDSTSPRVAEQAVDRLSAILLAQLELKGQQQERANRAEERKLQRELAAIKASVATQKQMEADAKYAALVKELEDDRDPFAA